MGIFNSYMLTMPPPYSIVFSGRTCKRSSYFLSFTNLLEILLYVLAILTVYSDTNSSGANYFGVRENWQWQVGAVSILLSWLVLVMFVQSLPRFGIFVIMFNDVLRTFMKFFVVFVLFIFGFALSFYCLLQNQYAFREWWIAVIKTSIMMMGEIQFDEIFLSEVDAVETGADNHTITVSTVNYRAVSYILFILFIIVMSIIIMNLLVGLAVDDIKSVQENAELESLAMQVKLTLEVEYTLPRVIRRKVMRRNKTFLKNLTDEHSSFMQWLTSAKNPNFLSITQYSDHEKTKLQEMEAKLEELQKQMEFLKSDLKDRTKSIESVAKAIATKLNVPYSSN
uniref:Transient receptor potential cation channel subfamily A member 1 homolog n=1 Tax=Phallusia mammillata TaxID=59560 RepID=A0A6F9DVS0_9ASCI|nr:transient receptor potential cation channel subfamily A member 1 homolog [Phallusia mammillata]